MAVNIIGDVHFRNHQKAGGAVNSVTGLNYRATLTSQVLGVAINLGRGSILLGDLFDSPRPSVVEISEILRLFNTYSGFLGAQILRGNHDSSDYGPGALRVLTNQYKMSVCCVPYYFKMDGVEFFAVPFQRGEAKEYLPKILDSHKVKNSVLLMHCGIWDEQTPEFMRNSPDSIGIKQLLDLAYKHRLKGVFAGNWHNYARWNSEDLGFCPIIQLGALVPTGWDNPGDNYGHVALVEHTGSNNISVEIKKLTTPSFITVTSEQLRGNIGSSLPGVIYLNNDYFIKVKTRPADMDFVIQTMDKLPWHYIIEIIKDDAAQLDKVQTFNFEDSIRAFSEKQEVVEKSLDYLRSV